MHKSSLPDNNNDVKLTECCWQRDPGLVVAYRAAIQEMLHNEVDSVVVSLAY